MAAGKCRVYTLGKRLGGCRACRKLGEGLERARCTDLFLVFPADDHEVTITGTRSGLGIRIVGGQRASPSQESQVLGIFIKEVIEGSLAEKDGTLKQYVALQSCRIFWCLVYIGRLKRGDQLVKANGVSLVGVSNER